jgi:hypothetical protein
MKYENVAPIMYIYCVYIFPNDVVYSNSQVWSSTPALMAFILVTDLLSIV